MFLSWDLRLVYNELHKELLSCFLQWLASQCLGMAAAEISPSFSCAVELQQVSAQHAIVFSLQKLYSFSMLIYDNKTAL